MSKPMKTNALDRVVERHGHFGIPGCPNGCDRCEADAQLAALKDATKKVSGHLIEEIARLRERISYMAAVANSVGEIGEAALNGEESLRGRWTR